MDPVEILRAMKASLGGGGETALSAVEGKLKDPFAVLVATVLSHRTRDERTSEAAMRLFGRFRTPQELAAADESEVAGLIRGVGFYRNKARAIINIAKEITTKHGGEVPRDLEGLLELPSVGRKTANCVLVYGFGLEAIPVDTHVHRIANRLGLVATRTPGETESRLMEIFPRNAWTEANDTFVMFGKKICKPIGPRCWSCPLTGFCMYYKTGSGRRTQGEREREVKRKS
ncbi:MAG: endonuclease III domain-containing protein [Candidatus Methanosuratincola sp.]